MNDVKLTELTLNNQRASATGAEGKQGAASSSGAPEGAPVSASASGQPAAASGAKQDELKEAVTRLNDYVQSVQRDLQFDLDDSSGKTVITVLDRQTQEVVRQIPDEVALKLARNLQTEEPVSLFNAKA